MCFSSLSFGRRAVSWYTHQVTCESCDRPFGRLHKRLCNWLFRVGWRGLRSIGENRTQNRLFSRFHCYRHSNFLFLLLISAQYCMRERLWNIRANACAPWRVWARSKKRVPAPSTAAESISSSERSRNRASLLGVRILAEAGVYSH